VVADGDVEAAVAREYAALVGDAGIVGVHFVLRQADIPAAATAAPGEAAARCGALLFRIVMFGVLQAFDRQVTANLSGDLLTGNLCAPDVQIVTGIDVQVVACAGFGIRPGGAVAVVFACGSVDVGEDSDARFLKSVWINGLAYLLSESDFTFSGGQRGRQRCAAAE